MKLYWVLPEGEYMENIFISGGVLLVLGFLFFITDPWFGIQRLTMKKISGKWRKKK